MQAATSHSSNSSWFDIPESHTPWLFKGLIPADGYSAVIGKPKAGKSTFLRSLIASVIKSEPFIERPTEIPPGTGRVLYIHLDRKDQDWRVAKELRDLGITQAEAQRLTLRTASDMKVETCEERLAWLQQETRAAKPHLIVMDLMWQFVVAKNSNDYTAVLNGINQMQDALKEIGFKGALIVALHGRKAVSATDSFDDIMGSTGQRGSFSTNIMLTRHRNDALDGKYTIASDQTERDPAYGEIPETVLERSPDGTLNLGESMRDIVKAEKKARSQSDRERLFDFLASHPNSTTEEIYKALGMAKKTVLKLIKELGAYVQQSGKGTRSDPYRYSVPDITSEYEPGDTEAPAGGQRVEDFINAYAK